MTLPRLLKPSAVPIRLERVISTGDDVWITGGVPVSDRQAVGIDPMARLVIFGLYPLFSPADISYPRGDPEG